MYNQHGNQVVALAVVTKLTYASSVHCSRILLPHANLITTLLYLLYTNA